MPKFLSDEEMSKLEGPAKAPARVISDDEMLALESGGGQRGPALEQEPGVTGGAFNPRGLVNMAAQAMGVDTATLGANAANFLSGGHLPQIAGAVKSATGGGSYVNERDATIKKMAADEARSPRSAMFGKGVGMASIGGATAAAGLVPSLAVGAGMGAGYNPGDKPGVVDPVQAGERAKGAGIGLATAGAGHGLAKLIGKGAQLAEDTRLVKGAGNAARYASEYMGGAKDKLQAFIKQKMGIVDDVVSGKTANVDLEKFRAVLPDLVEEIELRSQKVFTPRPNAQSGGVVTEQIQNGWNVPGSDIVKLRRAADNMAGYKNKGVIDPKHIATYDEAESLANSLRPTISSLDEAVAPANKAIEEAIPLSNVLEAAKAAKDPLQSMTSKSNRAAFDLVDQTVGTKLLERSGQLKTANELLLDPSNYYKGLTGGINELRKTAVRGAAEGARSLNKLPPGTKEASLAAALEAKRDKRTAK